MHRLLRLVGLLILPVTGLQAQQSPRGFEAWSTCSLALAPAPSAAPLRLRSVQVPRRDYRYEGLAVGGIAFGALGAWLGSRLTNACPTEPGVDCSPDRVGNTLVVGLAGAAVGGGLGYLVGRLSSKPAAATAGGTAP